MIGIMEKSQDGYVSQRYMLVLRPVVDNPQIYACFTPAPNLNVCTNAPVRDRLLPSLKLSVLVCYGYSNTAPQSGGLTRNLCSHSSGSLEIQEREGCEIIFFLSSLPLACKWLFSPCVFTWSFLLCVCVPISSFYKGTVYQIRVRPNELT